MEVCAMSSALWLIVVTLGPSEESLIPSSLKVNIPHHFPVNRFSWQWKKHIELKTKNKTDAEDRHAERSPTKKIQWKFRFPRWRNSKSSSHRVLDSRPTSTQKGMDITTTEPTTSVTTTTSEPAVTASFLEPPYAYFPDAEDRHAETPPTKKIQWKFRIPRWRNSKSSSHRVLDSRPISTQKGMDITTTESITSITTTTTTTETTTSVTTTTTEPTTSVTTTTTEPTTSITTTTTTEPTTSVTTTTSEPTTSITGFFGPPYAYFPGYLKPDQLHMCDSATCCPLSAMCCQTYFCCPFFAPNFASQFQSSCLFA